MSKNMALVPLTTYVIVSEINLSPQQIYGRTTFSLDFKTCKCDIYGATMQSSCPYRVEATRLDSVEMAELENTTKNLSLTSSG
jgi:hypothetical protein